jgi:hypothetical protein
VLQALASILLARLYRLDTDKTVHEVYRGFIIQGDLQDRVHRSRLARGRKPREHDPQGRWKNLETRFDHLNAELFGGALKRPTLAWSATASRRTLGRYDATHRAIVISRLFDSPNVPDLILDYVLYHEMLHARHPSRAGDCRWMAHPPEFRADERRFPGYREATRWLRNL